MAGSGGIRWQDGLEANLRLRLRQYMVTKLAEMYKTDQHADPEMFRFYAASVEEGAFSTAQSKADYLRMISVEMHSLSQNQQRSHSKQQMQIGDQVHLSNLVQAIQGGNSILATTSQAALEITSPVWPPSQQTNSQTALKMASPVGPPSQQPNWHMSSSNMQIGPSNTMAMVNPISNSQSTTLAPVALSVQSGQQIVQSLPMQSQNRHQAMQLQHTNFASCNPASVAQLQGQPAILPNAQPNNLLQQNASGICGVQQQQPTDLLRNQQGLGDNQHHTNSQSYLMIGANNMANLKNGYAGRLNNQQDVGCTAGLQSSFKKQINMESELITPAPAYGQVTVNQQGNMYRPSVQTPGTLNSYEAVDWREKMFQQIQSSKAAYYSELMELNQMIVVPTEEQLKSLPKHKAEAYKRNSSVKDVTNVVLEFLQLQKSEIPETHRVRLPKYQAAIHKLLDYHKKIKAHKKGSDIGQGSQDRHGKPVTIDLTGDTAPALGENSQQNQPKQSADASLSQMMQNDQKTNNSGPQYDSMKSIAPDNNCQQAVSSKLIVPASLDPPHTAANQTLVTKKPIDRLLDSVCASSPALLRSSVSSIMSALAEMDSVPLPTFCRANNKLKRTNDLTSSYSGSPTISGFDVSCSAYGGEHGAKRQKAQDLLDEIEAINSTLIDTTISIIEDYPADGIGGTLIQLSYTTVSLAPSLKARLLTSGMQPLVTPVTLFVPADHRATSSTVIYSEGCEQLRKKSSSISEEVDAAFRRTLRFLPELRSLKETASAWDACVRRAVIEFAHQHAEGALGSRFGQWESCVSA